MSDKASTSGVTDVAKDPASANFDPLLAMAKQAMAQQSRQVDTSKWVCIYPCYLNKSFSVSDGRKIPLSLALEDPVMAPHIADIVANKLKLPVVLERKRHPKDWRELGMGRVKVSLRTEAGEYINQDVTNRQQLFRACAALMKKYPMAVPEFPGYGTGNISTGNISTTSEKAGQKTSQKTGQKTGQKTSQKATQGGVTRLPARKKK